MGLPSWPGLRNPYPDHPVFLLGTQLEQKAQARRCPRLLRQLAYRSRRWVRLRLRHFRAVAHASPGKSLADVVTGVPLALIVFPPYRAWVFASPYLTWALVSTIPARVLLGAWRRNDSKKSVRNAVKEVQLTSVTAMEIARAHTRDMHAGQPLPSGNVLKRSVEQTLQAVVDVSGVGSQITADVELHANLMLPMVVPVQGLQERREGIGIVAYNRVPPNASWTKVIKGDLVAGRVLVGPGKIEVVEDTRDPVWCGVFDHLRARSFVSFPLRDSQDQVLGVVNIDADEPMTFRRKDVTKNLWPVISPQLRLLADVLEATQRPESGELPRATSSQRS